MLHPAGKVVKAPACMHWARTVCLIAIPQVFGTVQGQSSRMSVTKRVQTTVCSYVTAGVLLMPQRICVNLDSHKLLTVRHLLPAEQCMVSFVCVIHATDANPFIESSVASCLESSSIVLQVALIAFHLKETFICGVIAVLGGS